MDVDCSYQMETNIEYETKDNNNHNKMNEYSSCRIVWLSKMTTRNDLNIDVH